MLQIISFFVGVCILLLSLAFCLKKYARVILWSSAIILFAGTLLLVGIGVINPISEIKTGSSEFWGTIISLITGAALAFCAEMLKDKNHINKTEHATEVLSEEALDDEDHEICSEVVLTGLLDTELAQEIFARAIESGYIEQVGSHYRWKESKVLLAYMCGRIYCGDRPEYSRVDEKYYWKFGKVGVFPDSELAHLFDISDLGQSRSNRKNLSVPQNSKKINELFED